METVYIQDNTYMTTGCLKSELAYNFESGNYTIMVSENDDQSECLKRGLAEIEKRKEKLAAAYTTKKVGEIYRKFKLGQIQHKGIEGDFIANDIVNILSEQVTFVDNLAPLSSQVFEALKKRWNNEIMAAIGIYTMGRMAGIHAERERQFQKERATV
jgi:hypothetical protein